MIKTFSITNTLPSFLRNHWRESLTPIALLAVALATIIQFSESTPAPSLTPPTIDFLHAHQAR
ncbi:MAG: hypothetical protein AAF591_22800 [Verrucomicrobiota bacterium]